MKKVLIFALMLGTFVFAADNLKLYHDFNSGHEAALKENKMMMIMVHVKGCPECAYMKRVVFKDEKISAYMKKNFVNIALDFKETKIPQKYKFFGVPTFFLTDKDGNILVKKVGGSRGEAFLDILKEAKSKNRG